MHRTLRSSLTAAAAALALTTVACGREKAADDTATLPSTVPGTPPATASPTTTDSAAATMPGAPAGNLRITDVALGRAVRGDTAVVDEVDDFAATDTIHAIVRHVDAPAGATITARWTYQDGQVVDERTETLSAGGTTAAYSHFMIAKPSAWPKGDYKLHILVNGNEVETEDFNVK
ncbi:MAG TPA: hypothetical protein VHQ45_03570 [Gemmatimonadaceae bacterium]|jgi:hypothetical protein|nr:hypothetical protein [Gemmatimonadaceae bacterium]